MTTYLLVDCTYLCHRTFHAMGHLSHEGVGTGVAYGVIRDIENQVELHNASVTALAFDFGGPGKRQEIDPNYKSSRRERQQDLDEEEQATLDSFREQMALLQKEHLPNMGFKNVLSQRGYEADDILAAIAEEIREPDEAIIVTGDDDLWQCLRSNVRWHSPYEGQTVTFDSFKEKWSLDPVMWASVKALAGCSTDDVEGIKGVGEKTAAKWFNGNLKPTAKAYCKILNNLYVHNKNLPIVRLPLEGTVVPKLRQDEVTEEKRIRVQEDLGARPKRKRAGKSGVKKKGVKGFDV